MTLEVIIFFAAILFGILLYWRESKNNKLYRFINRLAYSKELQMKPTDKKGFLYQQLFLLRLVYIVLLFLLIIGITTFLVPISVASIQLFTASIVGTLLGTYIASAVLFANRKMEQNKNVVEDFVESGIEKGKDFIEDLTGDDIPDEVAKEPVPEEKTDKKSARERLKDKGYLK